MFTWDYEKGARPALNLLYEKAKTSQWNGETDLPWEIEVDQEAVVMANARRRVVAGRHRPRVAGTPFAKWNETEWLQFGVESQNWTPRQFMHGEQGALLHGQDHRDGAVVRRQVLRVDPGHGRGPPRRGVRQVPRREAAGLYPINAHLRLLLDDIVTDSRWDMTFLGMQIMVEGLALAAFGFIHQLTPEPLLKQLLRYVISDEARHVPFGVLSLKEYYADLTDAELRSARSSPSRPRCACATGSSSRRCGSAWA